MSVFIKIILISCLFSFLFIFLKSFKSEYAYVCLITGGASVIVTVVPYILNLISEIREVIPSSSYESVEIFIKCTLICQICALTKSFCKDSSNTFLASCVDLVEKTAVIYTAFPLIKALTEIINKYIGA